MPVAVGQTGKGRSTGASSVNATLNSAVSGSTYVAVLIWTSTSSFSSIGDTIGGGASGNTWTQIGTELALSGGAEARAYYVSAGFNGGTNHQVTLTTASSTALTLLVVEVTGVDTASLLTGTPSFQTDNTSPFTSGNVTTTDAAAMLIGAIVGDSGSNPATHAVSGASPASGWTIQAGAEETDGSQFWTGAIKSQVVSSTGTYNSGFTESGSGSTGDLLIAFKEASGIAANQLAWVVA